MKKVIDFLKILLSFLLGYLLFSFIIFLIEVILLKILSNGDIDILKLFLKSFLGNFKVYVFIYLGIFILNLLYNYISVKKLNNKLKEFKRKGDNYEK